MAITFEIIENNKDKIEGALDEAIDRALEACGLQAENYAKARCPVDTGLLRNSISHTHDGDTAYIGTNVEYAPYVELGHRKASGGTVPGAHFLKSAAEGHTDEYKRLIEQELKGF